MSDPHYGSIKGDPNNPGRPTPEAWEASRLLMQLGETQRGLVLCWFCPACHRYVGPGDSCTCQQSEPPAPGDFSQKLEAEQPASVEPARQPFTGKIYAVVAGSTPDEAMAHAREQLVDLNERRHALIRILRDGHPWQPAQPPPPHTTGWGPLGPTHCARCDWLHRGTHDCPQPDEEPLKHASWCPVGKDLVNAFRAGREVTASKPWVPKPGDRVVVTERLPDGRPIDQGPNVGDTITVKLATKENIHSTGWLVSSEEHHHPSLVRIEPAP